VKEKVNDLTIPGVENFWKPPSPFL
jgi:hypothetical protein